MRAIIQRVTRARVTVGHERIAEIGAGMLVLLGVTHSDTVDAAARLAKKVAGLRIFEDGEGKMNLDILAIGGEVLCVSQFTLYGDARRGNRPSFDGAAAGVQAEPLYERFCTEIEKSGVICHRGRFGADMQVELVNHGPVTLILDTDELDRPRHA